MRTSTCRVRCHLVSARSVILYRQRGFDDLHAFFEKNCEMVVRQWPIHWGVLGGLYPENGQTHAALRRTKKIRYSHKLLNMQSYQL